MPKGHYQRNSAQSQLSLICETYDAQITLHSARAAVRFSLKLARLFRWRSWLTWLWTTEWMEANFCKLPMLLKYSMTRSRRRNSWWEFSALLFNQRPVPCLSALPMAFMAARFAAAGRASSEFLRQILNRSGSTRIERFHG